MPDRPDILDVVLTCLKQMEATVLGLKQVRGFVGTGPGREMLDALIAEAEAHLATVKQRITQ